MAIKDGDYAASGDISGIGFAAAVTPADTDLPHITSSIYIGSDGDLKVMLAGSDQVVTFVGVKQGVVYPIRAKQIMAASTAGSILANYNFFNA